nr:protein-serine O-palmitoleoyltransferase porcupine-like [Lytechinus pictus]
MEGDWQDYEDYGDMMMEDYLPSLEDLEAMGIDPEQLRDLPDEALYQLIQQYMMDNNQMYDYAPGSDMGAESDFSHIQHIKDCSMSVALQGIHLMLPLFLLCVSLRVSAVLEISINFLHMVCACSGLYLMWITFQVDAAYIICLALLGYILLSALIRIDVKQKGPILAILCIITVISLELFVADPVSWHKVRGAQMILLMKVISVGFDLDQGILSSLPDIFEYFGYTFCVGTCIFGPWVSFSNYMAMLQPHQLNLQWFVHVITNALLAILCLLLSVCVTPVLFASYKARWLMAYSDAASFRYSHYFVSYLSTASSVLAGYGAVKDSDGNTSWEFSVAKPLHIEIPRSLVEVVTNWNLPMHYWLKNYVFKTSRNFGNFIAVLLTYAVSSILHGLNFQLAAVLLSLGFYSYSEHVFRHKLADIFSACIRARRCREECSHYYKNTHPCVITINIMFGLLAVFHLAYLGVMFNTDAEIQEEGYTMEHTLKKWSDLGYASHYVVLGTFLFYWLIK